MKTIFAKAEAIADEAEIPIAEIDPTATVLDGETWEEEFEAGTEALLVACAAAAC